MASSKLLSLELEYLFIDLTRKQGTKSFEDGREEVN
jgi:hypothetical protein